MKIHKIILKEISPSFAGKYRKREVRIKGSDFKLPSPEKIPQLMKNLIYWYKKNKRSLHPFELATIFSMKLVTIHPFVDGNGRCSRILMNFILEKFGYPWINIQFKNREDYLKSVRKANEEKYGEIIDFIINQLKKNIENL